MLQVVVLAYIGQKHVRHHVGIVHSHPLGVLQTHYMSRLLAQLLTCHLSNTLSNSLHLCRRVTLTNNEILTDSAFYLTQVSHYNL